MASPGLSLDGGCLGDCGRKFLDEGGRIKSALDRRRPSRGVVRPLDSERDELGRILIARARRFEWYRFQSVFKVWNTIFVALYSSEFGAWNAQWALQR